MNLSSKRQQGLTLISLVFLLGLIGFFVMIILKVVPIYMDHSKVKAAMEDLKQDSSFQSKSPLEIKDSLAKRFNINYVYDVKPDDIHIVKSGNYVKVEIEYETLVSLFGNLSLLAEFHDVVEAGQE